MPNQPGGGGDSGAANAALQSQFQRLLQSWQTGAGAGQLHGGASPSSFWY
jgi:hypothetical protein